MKRYVGKQLLACLLALVMFTTNVDAVCAAEAGAVSENGGVQGIASSEAAPGAGSGAVVRTMADGSTVIEPAAETATRDGIAGTSAASAVEDPFPAVQKTAAPADETPEEEVTATTDETPEAEIPAPADETTGEEITDPEEETGEADPAGDDDMVADPGADDPADLIDPAEEDSIADPDDPETLTLTLEEEDPELLGTVDSGTEGTLTWTLSDEGVLSFIATDNDNDSNQINNYSSSSRPSWEQYKSNIKEVHFSADVKRIGNHAFYKYTALEKVTFDEGSNLTGFGTNVFQGCTALAEIGMTDNQNLINGALPAGLTNIGDNMFNGCAITAITIPATVTIIEDNAFYNCSKLASVTFETDEQQGTAITKIGIDAFQSCKALTAIEVPATVTSIGVRAFQNCENLAVCTIPGNIQTIPDNAFNACEKMTSFTVPATVQSIGQAAFEGCEALTTVAFADDSALTEIKRDAFHACSVLKNIILPDGVTTIGEEAFGTCIALDENFALPSGLTSLGKKAFTECGALTQVTIPAGVQVIDENTFLKCSGLATLTWAEDATTNEIKTSAFQDCTALATVTLPASLTDIRATAFKNDTSLTGITIPKACIFLDGSAFDGCTNLKAVNVEDGNTAYYSVGGIVYKKEDGTQHIKPEGYPRIKVSVYDAGTEYSKEFSSFAEAASEEGLKSVANGIKGEYTFWFKDDVVLTDHVFLPDFVSVANFRSTGEYGEYDTVTGKTVMIYPQIRIDLKGHTLQGQDLNFYSTAIPYSSEYDAHINANGDYAAFAPVRYDRQAAGYTPGKFVRPDGTVAGIMPQADGTGIQVDHPECWTILLQNTDVSAPNGGVFVNSDPVCLEGFDSFSYDFSDIEFVSPTVQFWNGNYKLPVADYCRVLNIGRHACAETSQDIRVRHQLIIGNGGKLLVNAGDTVTVKKGDNKDTGTLIFTEEGSLFLNEDAAVETQYLATVRWRNPNDPTTAYASTGRIYQQAGASLTVTDNVTVDKLNTADPPLPIEFYPLTESAELEDLASADAVAGLCGSFTKGTKLFSLPADKAEKVIDGGLLTAVNKDPASRCTMIYPAAAQDTAGVFVGETVFTITAGGAEIGYPTITKLFTALSAINAPDQEVTVTLKADPGECELKFPKAAKQLRIVGAGGDSGTSEVTLKPTNTALNLPGETVLTNLNLEPMKATAITAASSLTLEDVTVRWAVTGTNKITVKGGTFTIVDDVFINTPMVFDGGNKAGFIMADGAHLYAFETGGASDAPDPLYKPEDTFYLIPSYNAPQLAYVKGGFQNFATFTVSANVYEDGDDPKQDSENNFLLMGESETKSPVLNNIAVMSLKDNTMYVMDRAATKGTVKLADLAVDGARFITEGSLNLTTLRLGNGSEVAALEAYNITGTLFNRTQADPNDPTAPLAATLTTAQRFKGQGLDAAGGAQLNITAAVNRVDADALPIAVRVLEKDAQAEAYHTADLICGDDKSDAYRRLLAVTNAAADDFTPDAGCVGGEEELDAEKLLSPDGSDPQGPYSTDDKWLLSRENKDFVVRSGADLTLLLLKQGPGDVYDQQIIGAYRTFKDVNAVIDARKDAEAFKENQFTILLLRDYNCSKDDQGNYTYTPGPVDFPYYTNHLEIRSVDADPETDGVQPHVLCFSGNLFVRQGVTFTDVRLEPYSRPGVENHTAQLQLRPRQGNWSFETDLHHVTGRIGAITGTMEANVWIEDCGTLVIENGISCGEVVAESDLTLANGSLTTGLLNVDGSRTIRVLNGSVTAKTTPGEQGLPGMISLPQGAQLLIPNGSLTAETLNLGRDSLIRVDKGTVTVNGAIVADDEVDTGNNEHVARIAFPAPGKSKPNFTVKGGIGLRSRDLPLELQLLPAGEQALTPGDLTLRLDPKNANKVLTTAAYQIADIGTNPSGSVKLFLENAGSGYGIDSTDYLPVKTGKLLYLADVRENGGTEDEINARSVIRPALTKLTRTSTDTYESCYLDYNNAVKEINTLADRTETYEITPGFLIAADAADRAVKDLELTDANKHSALTLPAKDKAAGVTVTGGKVQTGTDENTGDPIYEDRLLTLWFTGKVSGYGQLGFTGVTFRPCKTGTLSDAGSVDLTVGLNTGEQASSLLFDSWQDDPVPLVADGCSIGKITGVKAAAGKNNATRVVLDHVLLTLTTGFAGAPDVEMQTTAVLTRGKNEIGTLTLHDDSSLTSYGDLLLTNVAVELTDKNKANSVWIAGKQDGKGNSTIKLSGVIRRSVADFLPVKLIKSTEKGTERKAGDNIGVDLIAADTYAGKPLLYAPVADAAPVRAFPFLDDDEIISYKTPAMYVANGDKADMEVFIEAYDENDSTVLKTYAMSFYEAMQIIDNTGRTDYAYEVELRKTGEGDIITFTGKPGNEGKGTFGTMNLPSKAASVWIFSDSTYEDKYATLQFSGTVTAKCPVAFDHIKLQSGKMQNNVFTPDANGITLDTGAALAREAYKIELVDVFNNEAVTVADRQLKVSGIKGSSGLHLREEQRVVSTGAVTVASLMLDPGSALICHADLSVKGVTEIGSSNTGGSIIEGKDPAKKITLGDVKWAEYSPGSDSTLTIRYPLTKAVYTVSGGNRKLSKPPVSNLKITGEIGQKVKLRLEPQIWQEENALMHTEAGYYLLANPEKTPNADGYNQDMVALATDQLVAARRLAELTKAAVTSVQVMLGDTVYKLATDATGTSSIDGANAATAAAGKLRLLKQGGNLFLTTVSPVVRMTADLDADGNDDYDGSFCSLDEAAAEAKKLAKKENNAPVTEVTFTLLGNIGCEDPETEDDDEITALNITTPIAKLNFPAGVKKLTMQSERVDAPYGIAFTGSTVTLASDTVLKNVELYCVKKAGTEYTWIPYAVNIGTYTLTDYGSVYYCNEDNGNFHDGHWISKITGTGTLCVEEELCAQSISVKNLHVGESAVVRTDVENEGDLTVSGVTTLDTMADGSDCSDVRAGGKLTLNDVVLTAREPRSELLAGYSEAVEKNGKITSPAAYKITINGTVRCGHPEFAGVPDEKSAPLWIGGGEMINDGTILATAPKVPDGWFRPYKTASGDSDAIFVYKSGKNIITDEGKRAEVEAALYSSESFVDADGAYVKTDGGELTGERLRMKSDFLTVTEALKEVDSRAATARLADGISALNKGVKLPYEDQEVMLLSDARIENAQRTALAALTLPARVQTLTLSSGVDADADDVPDRVALRFTGGVTLKSNTVLTDAVDPVSMKSVTENKQQVWHPTPAAYALGAYTLTVRGVTGDGHTFGEHDYLDGICAQGSWSTIGNVTATAGKGRLVLENSVSRTDPAKRLVVTVSGNLNSDVSLQANTQLIAQGSASMNMLEFGEANRTLQHDWNPGAGIGGGSYGDPHEISCDESPVFTLAGSKALTLGVVLQHGESKFENPRDDNNHYWISTEAVPGILQKRDPSAPMVFKGSKEHENSRFVHDGDTADSATEIWVGPETVATVPADLCIFTGAGSVTDNPERLILRAGDGGNRYNWYTYKDGLYAGNLRPGQP